MAGAGFVLEGAEAPRLDGGGWEYALRALALGGAPARSRSPISGFRVGAAALGESGRVYLGTNLEFPGLPLNASVHAEQFAVTSAAHAGETRIRALALNAVPCGHCRQFLSELQGSRDLRVLVGLEASHALPDLLPHAFTPQDLQGPDPLLLLQPVHNGLRLAAPRGEGAGAGEGRGGEAGGALEAEALRQANAAFAPYTGCGAGVALRLRGGRVVSGGSMESCAYNPGMLPLQSALVAAVVAGVHDWDEIEAAVLAETRGPCQYASASHQLLQTIAPGVTLRVVHCEPAGDAGR